MTQSSRMPCKASFPHLVLAASDRWTMKAMGSALLFLAVVVSGCSQPVQSSSSAPTITSATSATLPTFSDWRAAYMDAAAHLHAVSLDGKTNLTGPSLSLSDLATKYASISPDGHMLAYTGAQGIVTRDITAQDPANQIEGSGGLAELSWSPNGSQLALGDGHGRLCVASSSGGPCNSSSPQQDKHLASIVDWTDNTHLAMTFLPPPPAGASNDTPRIGLGILDITSWSFHVVATFAASDLGLPAFSLSPDGNYALCYNTRYRSDPYTPMVDEIDLATGAITSLPNLASAVGQSSGFTSLAWRPGTHTIAASTGSVATGDLKTWLLDPQNDGATPLPLPAARYIGGWSPDGSRLIVTTGSLANGDTGPFEIDAVTVQAGRQLTSLALTKEAMTLPYIGFVRTV